MVIGIPPREKSSIKKWLELPYRRLRVFVVCISFFVVVWAAQGTASIKLDIKLVLICASSVNVDAIRIVRITYERKSLKSLETYLGLYNRCRVPVVQGFQIDLTFMKKKKIVQNARLTNWYLIFSDAIMFIGKKYVCYLNYGSYWLMACNNMSSISQVTASSQLENAFQRKVFG